MAISFESLQRSYQRLKAQTDCFKAMGMDIQSPEEPTPDSVQKQAGMFEGHGAKQHPIISKAVQFSGANQDPKINFSTENNETVDIAEFQLEYELAQRLAAQPGTAPKPKPH